MSQKRIVSLAGYPRSGTTFLGKVLNNFQDVVYVGEVDQGIKRILSNKNFESGHCSCGEQFRTCTIWGKLIPEIRERAQSRRYEEMLLDSSFVEFLYSRIWEASQESVIVDTSKEITLINTVQKKFPSQHRVVHILRDPRGVINSRNRTRRRLVKKGIHPNPKVAKQTNLLTIYDSLDWIKTNYAMRKAFLNMESMETVYEQWSADFESTLDRLRSFSQIGGPSAVVKKPHVLMGNINRFNVEKLDFSADLSWKNELSVFEKSAINVITMPYIKASGILNAKVN